VAGTLREYRERVVAGAPDIALVDLNLPDGRAVEILTAPPEVGAFPILIMTSYGNEQIVVEALKSGALDYVVKSAGAFAAMPRVVARALREWNLLREHQQAERALRQSEARFRTVARLSSDFAYSCARIGAGDCIVDWITDAFYTLTGFPKLNCASTRTGCSWCIPRIGKSLWNPCGACVPATPARTNFGSSHGRGASAGSSTAWSARRSPARWAACGFTAPCAT
jgi:CheY-like chemotaxis protein